VIVGGGNTAIDIAVQSRRLGAEDVTIVYRRGPEEMSATPDEREFAQVNGAKIKYWARPVRISGSNGQVQAIEFEYTRLDDQGRLTGTGERFSLAADMVFKAIGQLFLPDPLNKDAQQPLQLHGNRIAITSEHATSLPGVFAGGDCVATGHELTVQAVQDGKLAAEGIDRFLKSKSR
jgi:glutamate synthase (NADPH/NADH) small chain